MASNQNPPEKMNSFTKGMVKDSNDTYIGEGVWSHARNLVNNSHDGQMGVIGNEPSNLLCVTLPYTLIGCIASADDEWILFTTDNINSEIGIFNESECKYTKLVNDPCLKFNTKHLITGAARRTFDCSVKVYWADGNNFDRVMDIHNVPWKKLCTTSSTGCITCTNTTQLDCEQLRLAPLLTVPCLRVEKASGSGTLLNGTYQVAVAYMVNEIKVTDYLMVSNAVSIWSHSGVGGAINLSVTNTDPDFTEMEVVVISVVAGQTVAKQLGVYSTHQSNIYIDSIDPTLVTIPLANIPLITPALEKSDGIFPLNNYLLKTGIYTKPDFNYQPLANQIATKWVSVKYPADYYRKGGANVGYMRDEVYSFFIRWIYNTGDRSASYHIPGVASGVPSATINLSSTTLSDGGVPVQEGLMDYWQSTEKYPDDNPTVWNSFPLNTTSVYNLCGANIRHHKFPDNATIPHFENGGGSIYVLGVKFANIYPPKDINGVVISSIVGYEILRGSREGYKTIIAKGMVNNMKQYNIVDAKTNGATGQTALMQNYPYNDINTTPSGFAIDPFYDGNVGMTPLNKYVSFHSPDTTFQNPYMGQISLNIYGYVSGTMSGTYESPYKHPEFKILGQRGADLVNITSIVLGILNTIGAFFGTPPATIQGTTDMPYSMTIGVDVGSQPDTFGSILWAIRAGVNTVFTGLYYGFIGVKANAQKFAELVTSLIGSEQYASQFNSHGYYNSFNSKTATIGVSDYGYIKNSVQSFDSITINNLYRDPYVILKTGSAVPNPGTDNSLSILGNNGDYISRSISSNYGALKATLLSQYGQIDSIRQIPISSCVYKYTDSAVLFGGDTYINRYTEKNQYLFFNDWLIDQPEDYTHNYLFYQNIVGTYYFVDNRKAYADKADDSGTQPSSGTTGNGNNTPPPSPSAWNNVNATLFIVPKNYYRMHSPNNDKGKYPVDDNAMGWKVSGDYNFYIFCNGVRDFFVESEVNVGYRDWDEEISKRFYDPYGFTDLSGMFRSDIIKYSSGYYKYDYSLSVSRMYNQFISWGQVLSRSFNPQVAATCYAYYPRRIQYSLPQQEELKRDNWQSFLVNNYKDMQDEITCVKPINKTGALIMLRSKSPIQIMGVDSLQTDSGVKVTIGDGGLFSQSLQSLVNSDEIYQYGSCQNRWSITSTPQGVFYVSQDQGKVFLYTGSLQEISKMGMKWWFSRYLPSNLKKLYPDYLEGDNPVMGAGVTTVYDNINEIIYITKRDYIRKRNDIKYDPVIGFYLNDASSTITITDPYATTVGGVPNTTTVGYSLCPEGYTLINGACTQISKTLLSPTVSANIVISPITGVSYGSGGTILYNPGWKADKGIGPYTNIGLTNTFWINDRSVIDSGPVNGLINAKDVTSGTISHIVYLPDAGIKTYYVALTGYAGEQFKIKLDDVNILTSNPTDMATYLSASPESKYLHIYPVTVSEGKHTLILEGNYKGLGAMVINNTFNEIISAEGYADLNILFTTSPLRSFNTLSYPACASPSTIELIPGEQKYNCINTNTGDYSSRISLETFPPTPPRPIIRPIKVCDTAYFEDASWTISYDVKNNQWMGFHDWHPSFMLPSKRHFLTAYNVCNISQTGLWRHNDRWDDFCNFYGTYYPFEVEYVIPTGDTVTTMKNVEYVLEAYKYGTNGQDKFHLLDYNFDEAIVYNSEQTSGQLNLKLKSKSNPFSYLQYPNILATGSTDILFSKEEQKYRFNQFNDITKDRGEFSGAQNILTTTSPNGYTWTVNPIAVDYYKPALQRKKFRHNVGKVLLRKKAIDKKTTPTADGGIKILFKMITTKLQQSQK